MISIRLSVETGLAHEHDRCSAWVLAHSQNKCEFRPDHNGLFQRISTHTPPPPHPLWTTLNWVPKNLRISKKNNCSFCRIPEPADSNLEEFQNFAKIWMVFLEFQLKFAKVWRNLWISSHTHWAFLTGFPMSSMKGVWIFSGIAQYKADSFSTSLLQTMFYSKQAQKLGRNDTNVQLYLVSSASR